MKTFLLALALILSGCLPDPKAGPEERKVHEGLSTVEKVAVAIAPKSEGGGGLSELGRVGGPWGELIGSLSALAATAVGGGALHLVKKARAADDRARQAEEAGKVLVSAIGATKAINKDASKVVTEQIKKKKKNGTSVTIQKWVDQDESQHSA